MSWNSSWNLGTPRRSPPTSLRLVQGPVPPRSVPRHTLPSVPRPTFSQPAAVARGPAPRQQSAREGRTKFMDLEIVIPPLSSSLSSSSSSTSSRKFQRGPWDHAGSIGEVLDLNVEELLTPLKPAALA
ncbi:hypothetical protein DFH07DRAFT_958948 [Mycena maculata]|uniref:Uncharacterized protein n=1 Tax=Mycena maculata TaxID=230809 RepID=A0AAD7J5M3_9AGAR|nr:hypothetical protein DFH07DRAFT_958948 [Mycena maculata]